jgi:hypothetical protein
MQFIRSAGQRHSASAVPVTAPVAHWSVSQEDMLRRSQAVCEARDPSKPSAPDESGDMREADRTLVATSVGVGGAFAAANAIAASQHRAAQRLNRSAHWSSAEAVGARGASKATTLARSATIASKFGKQLQKGQNTCSSTGNGAIVTVSSTF